MMGAERRSMVMTDAQKEMTAYHEAGHAIVGISLPKCDPVYKATIIPRGGALGMVMSLPEMDRLNMFRDECHQRLAMTMAGKAAEVISNIDYAEAHEGYSGSTGGFSVSAETKGVIEEEVKDFIDAGYERAFKILTEKNDEFERLAQGLLEYETLTGAEIKRVMAGEPPHDDNDGADVPPASGTSVTAVPKTKPRKPKAPDPDLEPEAT